MIIENQIAIMEALERLQLFLPADEEIDASEGIPDAGAVHGVKKAEAEFRKMKGAK